MKKIFLALSLFIVTNCFSQVTMYNVISVNDIPIKTLDEVVLKIRNELSLTPCKKWTSPFPFEGRELTRIQYNVDDKTYFFYIFKDEILTSFGWLEKYSTKSEVEKEFERKVTILKQDLGIEPELLNYSNSNSLKSIFKYFETPTGDPDLYKIPLVNKDFATKALSLDFCNNYGFITNVAGFKPNEGLHQCSVGIFVDFNKEEVFCQFQFSLKEPFNLNISPSGIEP
jgi:hypothetical protein